MAEEEEEEEEEEEKCGGKGVWLKTLKSCCLIEFAFASSMPRFFGLRRTLGGLGAGCPCNPRVRVRREDGPESIDVETISDSEPGLLTRSRRGATQSLRLLTRSRRG